MAIVASRPDIVAEVMNADPSLKCFVAASTAAFLDQDIADDLVSGAPGNVVNTLEALATRERLLEISKMSLPRE